MTLEWSPLALKRARDIFEYIAEDKPSAAVDWLDRLMEVVERLQEHPKSGRMVPETDTERIREVMHGGYRVIYALDDTNDKIQILTVRRGSETLPAEDLVYD